MIWERGVYNVCLGSYLLYQLTLRPKWYIEPMPVWAKTGCQYANVAFQRAGLPEFFKHSCFAADVCPFGRGLGVLFFAYLFALALVDWASPEAATSASYVTQRAVIGALGLLLTLINPVVFMRLALPLLAELVLLAIGAHKGTGMYTVAGLYLVAFAGAHRLFFLRDVLGVPKGERGEADLKALAYEMWVLRGRGDVDGIADMFEKVNAKEQHAMSQWGDAMQLAWSMHNHKMQGGGYMGFIKTDSSRNYQEAQTEGGRDFGFYKQAYEMASPDAAAEVLYDKAPRFKYT